MAFRGHRLALFNNLVARTLYLESEIILAVQHGRRFAGAYHHTGPIPAGRWRRQRGQIRQLGIEGNFRRIHQLPRNLFSRWLRMVRTLVTELIAVEERIHNL